VCDPNCGDNDSNGDDAEAYMAESGNYEEQPNDEQNLRFTAVSRKTHELKAVKLSSCKKVICLRDVK